MYHGRSRSLQCRWPHACEWYEDEDLLEFEHLIEINDPARPDIRPLGRDELWRALVYRAKYPGQFNSALDSSLENETESSFTRVICAGSAVLRDEVTLVDKSEIRTLIDGQTQMMHAESVTRIEEPEPGRLFVRFIYRRDALDIGGVDANEFLKAAYLENDREAIARIRQMIAEGWSNQLM